MQRTAKEIKRKVGTTLTAQKPSDPQPNKSERRANMNRFDHLFLKREKYAQATIAISVGDKQFYCGHI